MITGIVSLHKKYFTIRRKFEMEVEFEDK